MMKIMCIGEEWRGSNSSGLFYAMSRLGHITSIINERQFVNQSAYNIILKACHRVIRFIQVKDFNKQLIDDTDVVMPDLVFIYKGSFIQPETLLFWKRMSIPVVNFYPDVSIFTHTKYISQCIPLYDHIFSTKTFTKRDLFEKYGYDSVTFIPHGFDPLLHRRLENIKLDPGFSNEASFIGNFSNKKETYLEKLKQKLPGLELKIWGETWNKNKYIDQNFKEAIVGRAVLGDQYVYAINQSKINLAILSEKVWGASSGDNITSRTFHIPASGGFMLHERTEEFLKYFEEDKEAVCFGSYDELIDKVKYYLTNTMERDNIAENGYKRTISEHSLDHRAKVILEKIKNLL